MTMRMFKQGYVYLLTNPSKITIYTGVTSDLKKRMCEHQNKVYPNSFTAKYEVTYWYIMKYMNPISLRLIGRKRSKGGVGKRKKH